MKKEASKEKYVYKTELQLMQEAYEGCCGKPRCKHQMDAYKNHPLPYKPADEDAEGIDPEDDDIFDDYEDDVDFYKSRSSGEDVFDSNMDGFKIDDNEEEYDDDGNRIESDDLNDDFIDEVRRLAPGIDEYLKDFGKSYNNDYECAKDIVEYFDLPKNKIELIADYVDAYKSGYIDDNIDDSDSRDDFDEENRDLTDEDEEFDTVDSNYTNEVVNSIFELLPHLKQSNALVYYIRYALTNSSPTRRGKTNPYYNATSAKEFLDQDDNEKLSTLKQWAAATLPRTEPSALLVKYCDRFLTDEDEEDIFDFNDEDGAI